MSNNTTVPYPVDYYMEGDLIFGLPVDTFAFIMLGVGLGVGLVVFVICCVIVRTCRVHGSDTKKNVRDMWIHDTIQRKEQLTKAGYVNNAFEFLDKISLDDYGRTELDSPGIRSLSKHVSKEDSEYYQQCSPARTKNNVRPMEFRFSKPIDRPHLQLNGHNITDIDSEISKDNVLNRSDNSRSDYSSIDSHYLTLPGLTSVCDIELSYDGTSLTSGIESLPPDDKSHQTLEKTTSLPQLAGQERNSFKSMSNGSCKAPTRTKSVNGVKKKRPNSAVVQNSKSNILMDVGVNDITYDGDVEGGIRNAGFSSFNGGTAH